MTRLLFAMLLVLILPATARAQQYGSSFPITSDSLLTSYGCFRQTAAEYARLYDSLSYNTPYTRTLLDSSGIKVTVQLTSAGTETTTGTTIWCNGPYVTLKFLRGEVMLNGNRPMVPANGKYVYRAIALNPGIDVNNTANTSVLNFEYLNWREAVSDLAPLYNAPGLPPIIIGEPDTTTPPPIIPPVITPPPVTAPANSVLWRVSFLQRRAAANSLQLADFGWLDTLNMPIAWPAGTIATSPASSPPGETAVALLDGLPSTKWLDLNFAPGNDSAVRGNSYVTFAVPVTANAPKIAGYRFVTGDDYPERDPVVIVIERSVDNALNWVRLDSTTLTPPTARGAAYPRRFGTTVPPTPVPPVVVVQLPATCDGSPRGFQFASASTAWSAKRYEKTEVFRGTICSGVVVLGNLSATRYHTYRPSCVTPGGWILLPKPYPSRAEATTAAGAPISCAISGTP